MKVLIAALIVIAATVCYPAAFAQESAAESEKLKYPKWDAGGSLGILMGGQQGLDCYCGGGAVAWAGNIDFGRYITQHWKVESGVMWTTQRRFYNSNSTYPQTFPFTNTTTLLQPTTFSGAVTYQFFENRFAHPYVSAGVHVTSFSEQTHTYTYNTNFSTAPMLTSSSRRYTEARPFVAAGFKSYFNERVYMRSEILGAFDGDGFYHGTARLGIGFDF